VFEAFFEALAALSATTHLVQMFNSPIVRAHVPLADMYENITDESAERTFDPPPLKWSTLKYVLRLTGGPQCPRSVTSRKRSSPSYARSM
jgi:hypothetical protein